MRMLVIVATVDDRRDPPPDRIGCEQIIADVKADAECIGAGDDRGRKVGGALG
jgi:hypothetical protein